MKTFITCVTSISCFVGGAYLRTQTPKIKTWLTISKKVKFTTPHNFIPNFSFEKSIKNIIVNNCQGVNVICLPNNFGTTTSLKHVASKIQSKEIKARDKKLKVMYIDG